jgi:hypothetical protein
METSLDKYEQLLAPARKRFDASPALRVMQSTPDARFVESFLLHFCAIGSRMTEPVESWIRRAAERCSELGFAGLAEALSKHAKAESGHHLMMLADLRKLAARWNAHRMPPVDAVALLKESQSPGALAYCRLHEENIESHTPYAQLAIEYEIEMLPLRFGELFVGRCLEILGIDVLSCLSFITEHIKLDIEHTKFNARELNKLMDLNPEMMPALVAAGTFALDTYAQFLGDCVELADSHFGRLTGPLSVGPSFQWQLHLPLRMSHNGNGHVLPSWLEDARSLRASVLWQNGRRPEFKTENGFSDPDPIDLNAFHILAYDGQRLVGCVRVHRLSSNGPPCLTETLLGDKAFSELIAGFGGLRTDTVEIGRWIVHPEFRKDGLAGLAVKLAAGSGALAMALGNHSKTTQGIAICSVGTADKQDMMLARLGLTILRDIEAIKDHHYEDELRIGVCLGPQTLSHSFRQMMDAMAKEIGITQRLSEIETQ